MMEPKRQRLFQARTWTIAVLMAVPILVYLALGGYTLWQSGMLRWIWWLFPVCWLLTWGLARVWKPRPLHEAQGLQPGSHWTERDRAAAEIVHRFQQRVESVSLKQLTNPHFYVEEVKSLALKLAQHYHPHAKDPYSTRTAPEIVAAVRLAIDDLESWMLESAPGSRLLTVNQWRMLQDAPKWMRRLQHAGWAASILINPANIASYYSSKVTIEPVTTELQIELLTILYLRFLRQMGFYLIEMNSGRLRGGADLYRQTFSRRGLEGLGPVRPAASAAAEAEATTSSSSAAVTSDNLFAAPSTVRIALVGQVNSGKSSLINILIGEDRTTVDTLPATRTVQRIEFEMGASGVTITLLDTPGYGESGASQMQLNEIQTALRTADAILLVMDAHSPARAADVQTLRDLKAWYRTHPQLKQAPVLGVLTHVDLLPPALQWEPPYDWRNPIEIKGERIAAAVQYASELFGQAVTAVVPVCTAAEPSRRWGIVDELLPELTLMLDDAHAASLLRAFEERLDKRPWAVLLQQLKRGSSELIQSWVRGQ